MFTKNNNEILYYEHFRGDILRYVPPKAKNVLSVGCAGGYAEKILIDRGIEVKGIELCHEAAEIAKKNGLDIIEGDVTQIDISTFNKKFDYLVYADVLEHLRCPQEILEEHVKYLNPGGRVYICIPNFRHYSVVSQLLFKGYITYTDAGILDKTHLRITTRKMVLRWIKAANLTFSSCRYSMHWRRHKVLSALTLGLARDFIAPQIGIVAHKEQ